MQKAIDRGTTGVMIAGLVGGVLLLAAFIHAISPAFDRGFARFVRFYEYLLAIALRRRIPALAVVGALTIPAWFAFQATGQELFPDVDSSEFTVHLRAAGGPRVEETERQIEQIENLIRGYEASATQLVREIRRSILLGEDDHLAAIRQANPDDVALFDGLEKAVRTRSPTKTPIAEAGLSRFWVPGIIPPEDLGLMLANVGISSRWSAIYTPNNGPHAAFLRIQLRSGFAGRETPTMAYVDALRDRLKQRFPTNEFFFETGGMIRRILNSGALAPIEVQVFGRDHEKRRQVTRLLQRELGQLASVHDANSPQSIDLPELRIVVDRIRASKPGLTENDVIQNVITSLMSSSQIAPNFWIDPRTGNPYIIGVQYPEYAVNDIRTLEEIPITGRKGGRPGSDRVKPGLQGGLDRMGHEGLPSSRGSKLPPVVRLEDVATIERGMGPIEVYHYAANRVSQIFVSVAESDIAGVAHDVDGVIRRFKLTYALDQLPPARKELGGDKTFFDQLKKYVEKPRAKERDIIRAGFAVDPAELLLPADTRIEVRGEVQSMRSSFDELLFSLAMAVLMVYLLMAAQFASWIDPLVMIVSAPLGLIGVSFTLWATGTSLNIQSCMGVLMMVGISVSNSVLVVEFANRQRETGMRTRDAILTACRVRLRPILITTIATLVCLAPMAIHRHPGDEMNLPLARAVMGGLAGSTLLTLFVVPILYSLLKPKHVMAAPPAANAPGSPGSTQPDGTNPHPDTSSHGEQR